MHFLLLLLLSNNVWSLRTDMQSFSFSLQSGSLYIEILNVFFMGFSFVIGTVENFLQHTVVLFAVVVLLLVAATTAIVVIAPHH